MTSQHLYDLTPNEQARAERLAWEGWQERQKIYNPPPTADGGDIIHEHRRVMQVLTDLVGWLPALLGLVMLAAIVVSLDKTASAFEASVAHKDGLWGAWTYIVAGAAVIMSDAALVVAEFALVRDQLAKGLHREVFTLRSLARGWRVFLGKEPPRDWHEMADATLKFYAKLLFWLVVSANVFAVTHAGNIDGLEDLTFENGLLMFTGVAGALSLRFIGRQVAHITYELARKRELLDNRDLLEAWTEEMKALWTQPGVGDVLVRQALHQAFIKKNKLRPGATSPYLLGASETAEGEATLVAVPLSPSPTSCAAPSATTKSADGRR
jgi:hypothetical protein